MERLKPHGIEPGAAAEVLTTEDGEARWRSIPAPVSTLDGLTDVDTTTTPPATGQALVWNASLGQWVPGDVGAAAGEPVVPTIAGSVTVHRTAGPYTVPIPGGVDPATFAGKFVLIAHWLTTPADVLADLLATSDWEVLAWTGTGRLGSGPFLAVLGGDPRTTVTLDAGAGACELSLLAVADASTFRDIPPRDATPVVVSACDTADGWTSPTDATVTAADGWVGASAGTSGEFYLKAVLDYGVEHDYADHPLLAVEWTPRYSSGPILNATAIIDGLTRNLSPIATTQIDADWRRTTFEVPPGLTSRIRFVAGDFGNGGPGYDLWIRHLDAHPSPHARIDQSVSTTQLELLTGVPTQQDDLFIVVGGVSNPDIPLTPAFYGGEWVEVADSNPGNPSLTTRSWAAPMQVGGSKRPQVAAGNSQPGMVIAAISVNGISSDPGGGGGGGGGVPTGGDPGDVLTLVDGEPAWMPPTGGAGDGLPAGGTPGQVLTIVNGVPTWQTPTISSATSYLVPLTTVVNGEPQFIWTEDNELVYTRENFQ